MNRTTILAARVDGRPVADSDEPFLEDRGLHYGDGLFETMVVRGGRVRFEAQHVARFATGCGRLDLCCDPASVFAEVRAFAAAVGEATVKLIVTRGTARVRGYAPVGDEVPRRVLLAYPPAPVIGAPAAPGAASAPAPASAAAPASFTLRRVAALYGENPALAGIKHLNRLEQVLARAEAQRLGVDEGLVCSSSGWLVSGTMSNVFLLDRHVLLTPSLQRCGIAGVTRAVVLREAARFGFDTREADIDPAALDRAEAVLVTNVRFGLRAATWVDGRALPPPPASLQALATHLATLDA
jgi:4-amino-4-deoxychorismate lyase